MTGFLRFQTKGRCVRTAKHFHSEPTPLASTRGRMGWRSMGSFQSFSCPLAPIYAPSRALSYTLPSFCNVTTLVDLLSVYAHTHKSTCRKICIDCKTRNKSRHLYSESKLGRAPQTDLYRNLSLTPGCPSCRYPLLHSPRI